MKWRWKRLATMDASVLGNVSGTSGAPTPSTPAATSSPPPIPTLSLGTLLIVQLLVSHSSATFKLPKMYRLKRRKLSLPQPSGRGLRGNEGWRMRDAGMRGEQSNDVASCVAHFPHQCAFILLLKPLRMNEWVPRETPILPLIPTSNMLHATSCILRLHFCFKWLTPPASSLLLSLCFSAEKKGRKEERKEITMHIS